jgi:hypothetical protein
MKGEKFDIVFVCHEKDRDTLVQSIKYAKKNILGYRKIFLVAKNNFLPENDEIEFVDEKFFSFDKNKIRKYVPIERVSWYFQQFLKLYFFKVMGRKTLDNILILDADTLFIKKTKFFDNGTPLYNIEIGYHQPYYNLMKKLFRLGRQSSFSGVTHHMIFQRRYVNELINFKFKNKTGEFWKEILKNIDKKTESGFSEYVLYFNYMLKNHPDKVKIRKLRFINFPHCGAGWIKFFGFLGYSYLSAHEYLKYKRFPIVESLFLEFLNITRLRMFVKRMLIAFDIRKVR